MTVKNRKANRSAQGSTIVEFAVVFTVLFSMIFGIIDFGRGVYAYHYVSNAAREASRFAALRGTASCKAPRTFPTDTDCPTQATDVTNYVYCSPSASNCPAPGLDHSGIYLNPAASNTAAGYLLVTTTWPGTTGNGVSSCVIGALGTVKDPGCVVIVAVQYNFGFSLPFVSQLGPLIIKSTSKFVISQ
jgi:Flp pilus assembly protein TadG